MRKATTTLQKAPSTTLSRLSKAELEGDGCCQARGSKPPSEEAVRFRAYERWEAAGQPAGEDIRFWLEAERELSQRH